MMLRTTTLATLTSLSLLFTACGGTATLAGGSGASATIAGDVANDSTDDFDVSVEQAESPSLPARGITTIDVQYLITIGNRTKVPVTVERITLQSIGNSAFEIPTRSRPFQTAIAPGEKKPFRFWAAANVTDPSVIRDPAIIRLEVTAKSDEDGTQRKESFMRRVNGRVAVGISR
jgi:hypothetical protein